MLRPLQLGHLAHLSDLAVLEPVEVYIDSPKRAEGIECRSRRAGWVLDQLTHTEGALGLLRGGGLGDQHRRIQDRYLRWHVGKEHDEISLGVEVEMGLPLQPQGDDLIDIPRICLSLTEAGAYVPGNTILISAPPRWLRPIVSLPPYELVISFTIASPMPWPLMFSSMRMPRWSACSI